MIVADKILYSIYSDDNFKRRHIPGGGALSIYTGGGVPQHIQKGGVLGTGTTKKMGVLGTGTTQKRGGLRHGHESKKGGLKNWSCKKDNLSN